MRKLLPLLLFGLLSVGTAVAEDVLRLHLTDGQTVTFALSDEPQLSMSADSMSVTLSAITFRYAHQDVRYLDYDYDRDNAVGIGAATADEAGVQAQFANGSLRVSGLSAGSLLRLFGMGGQLVRSLRAGSDGTAEVSLEGLPRGTYLLGDGRKVNVKFQKH